MLAAECARLRQQVADLTGQLHSRRESLGYLKAAHDFIYAHLKHLGVGIGLFPLDGKHPAFVSVTVEEIFQIPRAELESSPDRWQQAIWPEDLQGVRQAIDQAVGGHNTEVVFRIPGLESPRWVFAQMVAANELHMPYLVVSFEDITQRRKWETSTDETNARWTRVLDETSEGIWDWNISDGKVLYSPRWCELLGYSVGELDPHIRTCKRLVHPQEWPMVRRRLNDCLKDNSESTEFECRLRTKKGDWQWKHFRARVVLRKPDGTAQRVLGVTVDVEARKAAERSLHESKNRFRALAMHSPVGIFQVDLEGNTLFVNDRCRTIAGLGDGPESQIDWPSTLHPEDQPRTQAVWDQAVRMQAEFSCEYRFLHADKTVRWVWGNAVPVYDESGKLASYLGNILDISHRKLAEEALRASEQRFRLLSNCSPVGIFLADERGQMIYGNPRLRALTGYSSHEMFGMGFTRVLRDALPPSELEQWQQHHTHDVERELVDRGGKSHWVHIRSAPLIAGNGSVMGRVGTIEDITERREAEEQLRRSEERFRILAERSTDLISQHDASGVFVYASPACQALLGYTPQELLGTCAYDLFHPDDLAALREALLSAEEPLNSSTITYRIRHKAGHYIWFETSSQPLPEDPQGRESGIIAVSRDITIRRQAAEQLALSEARMRGILNTAADGILTFDADGMIELFNPGAERLFGYTTVEVEGHSIRMLLSPREDMQPVEVQTWLSGFRHTRAEPREVTGHRKDGSTIELEIRVGESIIGGRRTFTGILHDIGQRKATEQRLRESEKLAATGRIAARIAHEINNPLAGIKNSFLLVKGAIPTDHEYFSYVARIESEIDRIARIVRQMFELYRPDQTTRDEIHLGRTIHDIVALLSTTDPARRVTLEVDVGQVPDVVRLPEDSLRQVLYNLIVNAIEASPEGGRVTISAACSSSWVEIQISDQGSGIPASLRPRIYEPFFTTKSDHPSKGTGGLGLGLPISRGIIESLRGTLTFHCDSGQGTTFQVRLPLDHGRP